jgi:hypothetical protein
MENALGHEIEDVGEASSLIGCTREVFYEGRQVFNHGIIVGCVVTGDAEDLR